MSVDRKSGGSSRNSGENCTDGRGKGTSVQAENSAIMISPKTKRCLWQYMRNTMNTIEQTGTQISKPSYMWSP